MKLYANSDAIISFSVDIECELSEAEAYLKAMDIEFRTMPSVEKNNISVKLNEYKEEFKLLNQNFLRTKDEAESLAIKNGSASKAKLISANQKLDNSTATLEQSRQIIAQTDMLGNVIINDMENQKETLIGASAKVDETIGFTANAKTLLITMGNRAIRQTFCVGTVIMILAGLIGVVIYFAFIEPNLNK